MRNATLQIFKNKDLKMIFREINYDIHEIRIRWYINKEDLVNKNEFMKSDCKKTEIKNSPEH